MVYMIPRINDPRVNDTPREKLSTWKIGPKKMIPGIDDPREKLSTGKIGPG